MTVEWVAEWAWNTQAFADPSVDAVYGGLVYVSKDDTGRVIRS